MNLAEFYKYDFKESDFSLYDKDGNEIYFENYFHYWEKKFFKDNILIYFKNSNGYIENHKNIKINDGKNLTIAEKFNHDFQNDLFSLYDKNGNEVYYENVRGFWAKYIYNKKNQKIYFENSNGYFENYNDKKIIIPKLKKIRLHTETFIDSAHYLQGYDGSCKRLHGHEWRLRVWIEGYPIEVDEVGILFDFGNIKQLKKILDHRCLNDILPFKEKNPTAENITIFIYDHFKEIKPNLDFTIRVYETSLGKITYAEYGDFKI